MYVLITKAENKEGNKAATISDALCIATGLLENKSKNYSNQVFKTGEIVLDSKRCCKDGRKYWKWDIEYEEGFETVEDAIKRAKELNIEPIIHKKCNS